MTQTKNTITFYSFLPQTPLYLLFFVWGGAPFAFFVPLILSLINFSVLLITAFLISKFVLRKDFSARMIVMSSLCTVVISDVFGFVQQYVILTYDPDRQSITSMQPIVLVSQFFVLLLSFFFFLFVQTRRKKTPGKTLLLISVMIAIVNLPWVVILPMRKISSTINIAMHEGKEKKFEGVIQEKNTKFKVNFSYPATYSHRKSSGYEIVISRYTSRDITLNFVKNGAFEPYDSSKTIADWFTGELERVYQPAAGWKAPGVVIAPINSQEIEISGKKYVKFSPVISYEGVDKGIYVVPVDEPRLSIHYETAERWPVTEEEVNVILASFSAEQI